MGERVLGDRAPRGDRDSLGDLEPGDLGDLSSPSLGESKASGLPPRCVSSFVDGLSSLLVVNLLMREDSASNLMIFFPSNMIDLLLDGFFTPLGSFILSITGDAFVGFAPAASICSAATIAISMIKSSGITLLNAVHYLEEITGIRSNQLSSTVLYLLINKRIFIFLPGDNPCL